MSVEEGLKLIMSLGVVGPADKERLLKGDTPEALAHKEGRS